MKIVQIDMANWANLREMVESLGPIDLLVNNAAVARVTPFIETTEDDLD